MATVKSIQADLSSDIALRQSDVFAALRFAMTMSDRQLDRLSGILPLKTDSKLVQNVCLHEPPRFKSQLKQLHKLIHDMAV